MYEDNAKKFNWLGVLKGIITVIVIGLIIFGIYLLVQKFMNKNKEKENNKIEPVQASLKVQLDKMEEATLKYIDKDYMTSLTDTNPKKTIKLKWLVNKNLIDSNLKDASGNVCDTDNSYAEVTKKSENYAIRLSLTCGTNSDYKTIYVGCFDNCDGGVCVGNENSTGGICNITTENKIEETKPSTNNTSSNSTNNNSSSSKSSGTSTNTTETKTETKKTTYYEQKKCNKTYSCAKGTLTNDNKCAYEEETTVYGETVSDSLPRTVTPSIREEKLDPEILEPKVSTKNGKTVYTCPDASKYDFDPIARKCVEKNVKTKTVYICPDAEHYTFDGVNKVCVRKQVDETKCTDNSYTYNSNTNRCEKKTTTTKYTEATSNDSCETTWSLDKNVKGWTFTGNTKEE